MPPPSRPEAAAATRRARRDPIAAVIIGRSLARKEMQGPGQPFAAAAPTWSARGPHGLRNRLQQFRPARSYVTTLPSRPIRTLAGISETANDPAISCSPSPLEYVRPGDSKFDKESPHEPHSFRTAIQVDPQDREAVLLMQLEGAIQYRDPLDAWVAPGGPEDDEDDLVLEFIETDIATIDVGALDARCRPTDEVEPSPVAGEVVTYRRVDGPPGDEVADLAGEVEPPTRTRRRKYASPIVRTVRAWIGDAGAARRAGGPQVRPEVAHRPS